MTEITKDTNGRSIPEPTAPLSPETEQEWAAYYQSRKEHPDFIDEWELMAPPPSPPRRGPGRPSRGLQAHIGVRLTADEVEWLGQEARETGQTFSEVLRAALLAYRAARTPSPGQ